jgi:hypothetical protein
MGAKQNLQKEKGGGTALEKSISFKVIHDKDGFVIQFYMAEYGEFLDKGVSGKSNSVNYTNYKGKSQSSPYKYTTKGPPVDILSKWIKRKGIKPKGLGRGRSKKTGQFISGFAYLISKKIKREGIKSLSFFQKPLGLGLERYGKNFLQNLKEDILDGITTKTIKA